MGILFRRRWALAGAAAVLLPMAAGAQTNLFRFNANGPHLTTGDYDRLLASVARLNDAAPPPVGRTDAWNNPATKASGTNTLVALAGACHVLTHHIATPRRPHPFDYRLTWCPTAAGWKVKG